MIGVKNALSLKTIELAQCGNATTHDAMTPTTVILSKPILTILVTFAFIEFQFPNSFDKLKHVLSS